MPTKPRRGSRITIRVDATFTMTPRMIRRACTLLGTIVLAVLAALGLPVLHLLP